MAQASGRQAIIASLGILFLAGCQEGGVLPLASRADTSADVAETGTGQAGERPDGAIVEKDMEAPDVFATNESGLWDGRPSLGGVWVAHPDVTDPERVMIRNEANGKFVVGALFRRERDNPGPRLQVSSDAASELGLLAGQPVNLDVVALRRETVEIPTLPAEADGAVSVADADGPLSGETAAVALAGGADTGTAEADATQLAGSPAPAAAPAKKRGFLQALFGKRAPKSTPAPAAPAGAIETAALDPVALASAAIDEVDAETGSIAPASKAAPAAATPADALAIAPAAASDATAPDGKSPKEPYIQVAIFSVEKNARESADGLRKAGLVPGLREQKSGDKAFWRVVVGPATTLDERKALLARIRDLGYADAYYVTN